MKRWLLGKDDPYGGDPDFEGTLCLLNALDAIDWLKATGRPESPEDGVDHIGTKTAKGRKQIEKRPNDRPRQAEGESRP